MRELMQALFERYQRDVYLCLFSLCHDAALAEELTADTFLAVVQSLHRFRGDSDEKTWLFSVARHRWYHYLRKKKQEPTDVLAAEYGTLHLTVESEETTAEMAAQSLLAIRQIMERGGLPFCSVEFWINSPEEDESGMPKSTFHILNFGWDEIQEEGLVERAAAAAEATEAYYR